VNYCETLLDGYSESTFNTSVQALFITGVASAGGIQESRISILSVVGPDR